jgi:hypothetical protein
MKNLIYIFIRQSQNESQPCSFTGECTIDKRLDNGSGVSREVHAPFCEQRRGKCLTLTLPCFEDKIVEETVATLLSAIYETKFLESSYGSRPGKNCHQAIQQVNELIIDLIYSSRIKSYRIIKLIIAK